MESVDLHEFLTRGLTVLVATRDAGLMPLCSSGSALVVPSAGRAVVFVPEYDSARTLENLRDNGCIAVVLEQPTTHRGIQLKGRVLEIRPATDAEHTGVMTFMQRAGAEYLSIGIAPSVLERVVFMPCIAIEFEYTDVFEQTPGPGAGKAVRTPA